MTACRWMMPWAAHGCIIAALPHVVFAEGEAGEALAERGHVVEGVSEIGRVLAIHCPDGLRNAPDSCMAVTDPRVPD